MRLGNKHRAADDAARLQIVDRLIGPLEASGLDRYGGDLTARNERQEVLQFGQGPDERSDDASGT